MMAANDNTWMDRPLSLSQAVAGLFICAAIIAGIVLGPFPRLGWREPGKFSLKPADKVFNIRTARAP